MENAVVEHFQRVEEKSHFSGTILSCKHISRGTGFKCRRVFALLNKSPKFQRLEGEYVGYGGERYSFYRLSNC